MTQAQKKAFVARMKKARLAKTKTAKPKPNKSAKRKRAKKINAPRKRKSTNKPATRPHRAKARLRSTKKNSSRKVRRNSLEAAKQTYRDFHGRDADKTLVVVEKVHTHEHLSGIGDLEKLIVIPLDRQGYVSLRYKVTLTFNKGTILAQNEKPKNPGTFSGQLFIRGGDQSVDLKLFGIEKPYHESEVLGELQAIFYFTRKDHLAPKWGGTATYHHKFKRPKPTLIYDTVNKLLSIAGGRYAIPDEGIDR